MTTTRITARVRRDIARELGDDPRVRHWLEQLTANPDALPGDLDDDQLAFIHRELMRRSGGGYDSSEFARAMELTAPVLRAPRGGLAAVPAIMAQPEVHEFLFEGWRGPRGARGPAPAYQDAKAVLATMAFGRTGSYVDKAHGQLAADPVHLRQQRILQSHGQHAAHQQRLEPEPPSKRKDRRAQDETAGHHRGLGGKRPVRRHAGRQQKGEEEHAFARLGEGLHAGVQVEAIDRPIAEESHLVCRRRN